MASIELNALWASEAMFLACMADELGKPEEARAFRDRRDAMARRINSLMWNDELGMYCSRHWPERPRGREIPNQWLTTPDGKAGLLGEYFAGVNFENRKLVRIDANVDFDWYRQSVDWFRESRGHAFDVKPGALTKPHAVLPDTNYSVRWTGRITPPEGGQRVFIIAASDGARLWIDGRKVFDDWDSHTPFESTMGNVGCPPVMGRPIDLEAGKAHKLTLEYKHRQSPSKIHLRSAHWPLRDRDLFSPHLAPPNFYPMIAGIPDPTQAKRMLSCLLDEKKFWGPYVCPTISRDNRAFKEQSYWRGFIWPGTNYLLYQSLKRYAPASVRREYVQKSLALFRRHEFPGEAYSWDGAFNRGPYSWGVLLPLMVLEEICDIEPDGRIRLNGTWDQAMTIHNLPLFGKRYDVAVTPGCTTLLRDGQVVLRAERRVVQGHIAR